MSENLKNSTQKKYYNFRGKRVSKKVYDQRIKLVEIGKNIRKIYGTKSKHNLSVEEKSAENLNDLEGRRIVHLKTLGNEMYCKQCNYPLNFNNIVEETRHGLASIFWIKCASCNSTNKVHTDKQHKSAVTNKPVFDINTKTALGTLNAGMGNSHLNTLLTTMNIPEFYSSTYKTYEKEVGSAVEKLAHESCAKAAQLERELTIKNFEELNKLL